MSSKKITKIIKFGASWCGQCRGLDKIIASIKDTTLKNIELESIDVDDESKLGLLLQYNIRNIPVMIFLNQDNEEVGKHVGLATASTIESIILTAEP